MLVEEACDPSRCLEIPLEQLRNMGTFRAYTFNKAKKLYSGYCPYTEDNEISENADGSLKYIQRASCGSGLRCSSYTNLVSQFTSPSHLSNGKFRFLENVQGNITWVNYYILFVPGGPNVQARCQSNPPPSYGKTSARIIALKPVDGNCTRDESILNSFLENYPVDWQQVTVDCH